jgi:hypothetical protein
VRRPRRLALHAASLALLGLAAVAAAAPPAAATTITIVNADGAGEGFNDPTPALPVLGNAATTRGQQRLNVFAAAAAYWANRLSTAAPIVVRAQLDPLTCTPTSAILGAAGPHDAYADFPDAPVSSVWFPSALANALHGSDMDPAVQDIDATFNSSLDGSIGCLGGFGWSYVIGGPPGAHQQSLYDTVVHEIGHGLGFLTLVEPTTGMRPFDLDDIFMTFLEDHSTGKTWSQMSNAERVVSARDTGDLHFVGPHAVAASAPLAAGRHPGGHIQMYAPNPVQRGSSVSHWDTALLPDEIMEPIATQSPHDTVTTEALRDLGWVLQQTTPSGACSSSAQVACLHGGRFEVKVHWETASSSGEAQVMSFDGRAAQNSDSVFWTFFGPTNFELGVKVLDACVFGKYWVFTSGLTDQGWTVTIRDTQTGLTRTYSNTVGHLSATVADTSSFSCP